AQGRAAKQRGKRKLRLRKEEDRGTKKQKATRATTLPFPITAAEGQTGQAESAIRLRRTKPETTKPAAAAITRPIWQRKGSTRAAEGPPLPGKQRAAKVGATKAGRISFAVTERGKTGRATAKRRGRRILPRPRAEVTAPGYRPGAKRQRTAVAESGRG